MPGGFSGGGGVGGSGEPNAAEAGKDLVVSDEIVWRNRALEAEQRVEELEQDLGTCRETLEQARETIDAAELSRQIERELVKAEAIDLETAMMLTEAAVLEMDEPDVQSVVRELRKRKAFLFKGSTGGSRGRGGRVSAMSSVVQDGDAEERALAAFARSSGDRSALLRYMRLRRSGG